MSKVYLVGAGPGDPELVTLKAARVLAEADVILYDQLANPEVLRCCRPDAEFVFVGKAKGDHTFAQGEINELLYSLSTQHAVVVRLKGGDPLTFGRGGEEYEHLVRRGVDCEIIPGITSAAAASAAFGLPLTHREHAPSVRFVTGHRAGEGEAASFSGIRVKGQTLVIYMGLSRLEQIMAELGALEENRDAPVAIVEKVSRPKQRILFGTVASITEIVRAAGVQSPALTIVGDVVGLARTLAELRGTSGQPPR